MRRFRMSIMFLLLSASAFAQTEIASIDYLDGPVNVKRDGDLLPSVSIGDPLYDGDMISTGSAGKASIALAASTDMKGSIQVAPNSSFYLEHELLAGESKNKAELIAGQLSLKVKKLGGAPSFTVSTETAVMTVRGTEFEVSTTDSGSVLVNCSEGEVACSDEEGQTSAVPGQLVQKREGEQLSRFSVQIADYQAYREHWLAAEDEAFRQNAPKAARAIALRYRELAEKLVQLHTQLFASGVLQHWIQDWKSKPPKLEDPQQLKADLAEVGPSLAGARRLLASMERLDNQVIALQRVVGQDSDVLGQKLNEKVTIGDFFRRFDTERAKNAQRAAWIRRASGLFRQHKAETDEQASGQ